MFFRKKKLSDHLGSTKLIKVMGMFFRIRKINPLDYLEGSNALKQAYDLYKTGTITETDIRSTKIKKHYIDVLMAGIVEPKLTRKEDGDDLYVGNLFSDMELVGDLYTAIYENTYGKKKLKRMGYQRNGF